MKSFREGEPHSMSDIVDIDPAKLVIGACVGVLIANSAILVLKPGVYGIETAAILSGVGGQFGASLAEATVMLVRETRLGISALRQMRGRLRFFPESSAS